MVVTTTGGTVVDETDLLAELLDTGGADTGPLARLVEFVGNVAVVTLDSGSASPEVSTTSTLGAGFVHAVAGWA